MAVVHYGTVGAFVGRYPLVALVVAAVLSLPSLAALLLYGFGWLQ